MQLELIAVLGLGMLIATRVFIALFDSHYRNTLDVRRAINAARERMEEEIRRRAQRAKEEAL